MAMSGKDYEPWFRGYALRYTRSYFWYPIHWKGVLLTFAFLTGVGINIVVITSGLLRDDRIGWLLAADLIPALLWRWVFMDRVEWVEPARRKRKKNDLRNGLP